MDQFIGKEAIYQGFKQLKPAERLYPNTEKHKHVNMRADWLIGMNSGPLVVFSLQQKGISGSFSLGARADANALYDLPVTRRNQEV